MKHFLTSLLLTLLMLSACTKEVVIDIPGYEEQLVIDGTIETDQPPIVFLTKSKDIYAPTDLEAFLSSFVSGATVTVSNGTTTVQLTEVCSDNLPPGSEPIVAELLGIPEDELGNYHICGYTSLDPAIFGEIGKNIQPLRFIRRKNTYCTDKNFTSNLFQLHFLETRWRFNNTWVFLGEFK